MILGSLLIILGFYELKLGAKSTGFGFMVLGTLLTLSGVYYVRKILAFRAALRPEDK